MRDQIAAQPARQEEPWVEQCLAASESAKSPGWLRFGADRQRTEVSDDARAPEMELSGFLSGVLVGGLLGAAGVILRRRRSRLSKKIGAGIGVVGAVLGAALAWLLGVADTPGVDWIELGLQAFFAALGVMLSVYLLGGEPP